MGIRVKDGYEYKSGKLAVLDEFRLRPDDGSVGVVPGLFIPPHDHVKMTYTSSNTKPSTITYFMGDPDDSDDEKKGVEVCKLTQTVDASDRITKIVATYG